MRFAKLRECWTLSMRAMRHCSLAYLLTVGIAGGAAHAQRTATRDAGRLAGLEVMRIMEAAYRSAETGREVRIE